MVNVPLKAWASIYESAWYVYGTLIGESITRDANTVGANAIRWVVGIWILYCFVIGASYSGSLKAFLTNPGYSSPINTLGDVLESGLPWGMVSLANIFQLLMSLLQGALWRRRRRNDGLKSYWIRCKNYLG